MTFASFGLLFVRGLDLIFSIKVHTVGFEGNFYQKKDKKNNQTIKVRRSLLHHWVLLVMVKHLCGIFCWQIPKYGRNVRNLVEMSVKKISLNRAILTSTTKINGPIREAHFMVGATTRPDVMSGWGCIHLSHRMC